MDATPTKPRRWFRFSLRTTFLVVTAISLWLGYEVNWIGQRHAFLARQLNVVRASHPQYQYESRPWATSGAKAPGLLWMFGEKGFSTVVLLIRESDARELAPKPDRLAYTLADSDGE